MTDNLVLSAQIVAVAMTPPSAAALLWHQGGCSVTKWTLFGSKHGQGLACSV